MKLSRHFTLKEATKSDTADARALSNQPDEDELKVLRETARQMELVRAILEEKPVIVTSWFRSQAVNEAVGGVPNSGHRKGVAVDFHAPQYGSITNVCQAIANSGLRYDQLIWERGRWCHISFDSQMRGENLTYDGNGYSQGLPEA